MLEISLNGEAQQTTHSILADLLHAFEFEVGKVAVAVNQTFVAKTDYAEFEINHGDKIDVIAPIWGG
jgi:sulfur carrier protein